MLTVCSPLMQVLNALTHSVSMLLYWFVPSKLAKFYVEYEPQGKKDAYLFVGLSGLSQRFWVK